MGRSQETFQKKEVRSKKEKKRKEKLQRRQDRKDKPKSGTLDDMIAYVDENGVITSTPPDPTKKTVIKSEDIEIDLTKRESVKERDIVRKGIVSYYNDSKGFGFIRDKETKQTVFFHVNNLIDDVKENSAVTFEIGKGPKGPTANQVRLDK